MAKPLTPAKKKKIVAAWADCQNYSEVARIHKVSVPTVIDVIKKMKEEDPDFLNNLKQKRQEESESVLEWYSKQSEAKKELLENLMVGMNAKAAKPDMFTSLVDMAKTMGIVLDKEYKALELQIQNAGNTRTIETDKLSEALEKIGLSMDEEQNDGE